jgi:hypothetical protein
MAERWVKEYDLELEQEGINKDQILKNRDYEFNNLVDRCNVVYSNFSKMIGFV